MSTTVDTTFIDKTVNEAIVQFLIETKLNARMASLSVSANTADYTVDTDILSFQGAWYEPANTSDRKLLERVSYETLIEMRLPPNTDTHTTRYYAFSGAHTIHFHPAPESNDDNLHILYIPRPAALSTSADTPAASANGNIPEEYHPLLEAYAKWKCGEAEEHKGSEHGMTWRAEWEQGIAKIRGQLQRKPGMVQPSVRIGRPSRLPVSPGVDTGF